MIGRATGLRFGRCLDRWTPGETLFPSEAINSWAEADSSREKMKKGIGEPLLYFQERKIRERKREKIRVKARVLRVILRVLPGLRSGSKIFFFFLFGAGFTSKRVRISVTSCNLFL